MEFGGRRIACSGIEAPAELLAVPHEGMQHRYSINFADAQ
jgi:hypothetical protein